MAGVGMGRGCSKRTRQPLKPVASSLNASGLAAWRRFLNRLKFSNIVLSLVRWFDIGLWFRSAGGARPVDSVSSISEPLPTITKPFPAMSIRALGFIPLCFFTVYSSLIGADWPGWRGHDGLGVSAEKRLPTTWSQTENIAWTT